MRPRGATPARLLGAVRTRTRARASGEPDHGHAHRTGYTAVFADRPERRTGIAPTERAVGDGDAASDARSVTRADAVASVRADYLALRRARDAG